MAPADFVRLIFGDGVIVDVAELTEVTADPVGGVPEAVAVLTTVPAFTSAWVSV
jgi:hypothetical protein